MTTLVLDLPGSFPVSVRNRMVKLLNQQLANAIDLQVQSTHTQWSIRGPQFLALHLFCDQIANAVAETVTEIAGRTAQLGGMSSGALRSLIGTSHLPEYPFSLCSNELHIAALGRALASFVASTREAARMAFDIQDFATTDVLARVGQVTDKLLGLVNSYLERSRPKTAVAERTTDGAIFRSEAKQKYRRTAIVAQAEIQSTEPCNMAY